MNPERKPELENNHYPDWSLFQQSLTPDTPAEIAQLLHQYYNARLKVLNGDREGAKEIYDQIDQDLLNSLEESESGDINFIGLILTGANIFQAPNKMRYFSKELAAAISPKDSDLSSN